MKKRILGLILAIIACIGLCLGLVGCGDDKNKTHKIIFESQGGSSVQEYEDLVEYEPIPTKQNYFFKGWYLEENCSGDKVSFPFIATENTTLYAKWEEDTRTPIEKFVDDGGKYTAKIDKQYFYFSYDILSAMIHVESSYDSGLITFFKFEYNFPVGNATGIGSIQGTDKSRYSVQITSFSSSGSITVKCTHVSGTDWTKPDVVGLQSKFINNIPKSFGQFYSHCKTSYNLLVF